MSEIRKSTPFFDSKNLPLYPQGIMGVYSPEDQPSNVNLTPRDREEIITRRNTPHYLHGLVNPAHPDNVYWEHVKKAGLIVGAVQSKWPLQGWGYGALMVTAAPEAFVHEAVDVTQLNLDDHGRMPVQFIHDNYPQEVQQQYAAHTLAGLIVLDEVKLPGETRLDGVPSVVGIENAVSTLGSGRTIAFQHLQLRKTGFPVREDEEPHFATSLTRSQRLQRNYPRASEVLTSIEESMRKDLGDFGKELHFEPRQAVKPFGYTITTPLTRSAIENHLDDSASLFAALMRSHYKANKQAIQAEIDRLPEGERSRIKEPYSNYHYFYLLPDEKGIEKFHFTNSLALFPGAGVENGGVELRRGAKYTLPFTSNEEYNFQREVEQKLQSRLNPSEGVLVDFSHT